MDAKGKETQRGFSQQPQAGLSRTPSDLYLTHISDILGMGSAIRLCLAFLAAVPILLLLQRRLVRPKYPDEWRRFKPEVWLMGHIAVVPFS
jgi:hypothetical protein